MFNKRLLICTLVVFVFMFFYEFGFHAIFLSSDYEKLPAIMRPDADMQSLFHFLVLGLLLMSYIICVVFERGYENKGLAEGVRFGLLVGLLLSGPSLIFYAVMQFPGDLVVKWIVGGLLEMVLAGMLLATTYGKLKA